MKIFPKTFLYTLALLILIALLANGLIYTLMPTVYKSHKQQNLANQADKLAGQLQTAKQEDIAVIMGGFSAIVQANITVEVGGNKYALIMWNDSAHSTDTMTTYVTVSSVSAPSVKNGNVYVTKVFTDGESESINKGTKTVVSADSTSGTAGSLTYIPAQTITAHRSFTMDGKQGALNLAVTLAPVEEAVNVIVSLLPISIILCVVIAVVFSLFYARAITRPIKAISETAHRMTVLERNALCEINSKDEIGELAANVNGLYRNLLNTIASLEDELKKVAEAEKAKTDFLRAASHELKTPLTAAGVIMDNMILGVGKYKNHGEWLPKCRDLMENLSIKLREILDASRLEDIIEPSVTENLEVICSSVLEPYLMIARAKGLALYIDLSASFQITALMKLLSKALSNIFSNAVQYTLPGGKMSVYCRGKCLIIENECIPIPESETSRLREPFYRLDVSRSRETGGNGLGLYIVDTILRRLGLNYSFEPTTAPEGMRFTIKF